jgi:hypothetical protein
MTRCRSQEDKNGSLTARWLEFWDFRSPVTNPPLLTGIPQNLWYLRTYFQARANIAPQRTEEPGKTFKRRVYATLCHMARSEQEAPRMRIMTLHPAVKWSVMWKTFGIAILPDRIRSTWNRVLHDSMPTNVRLYKIYLSDTDGCSQCDAQGTLLHRLTECGESAAIWQ